jgi:DNA-binding XRE family transcriptional regulator
MNQTILAQNLGVSRRSIVEWEHVRTVPNIRLFIQWAQVLGFRLQVWELHTGDRYAMTVSSGDESFEVRESAFLVDVLRQLRAGHRITQEVLADRLGMTAWSISRYELAREQPHMITLIAWCAALGCNILLVRM